MSTPAAAPVPWWESPAARAKDTGRPWWCDPKAAQRRRANEQQRCSDLKKIEIGYLLKEKVNHAGSKFFG